MTRNRQVVNTFPRYIKPENIEVGDLIRVTVKREDVEVSTTGRVHRRDYQGSDRVFYTAEGVILTTWNPHYPYRERVTLIEKMKIAEPTLFDIDEFVS